MMRLLSYSGCVVVLVLGCGAGASNSKASGGETNNGGNGAGGTTTTGATSSTAGEGVGGKHTPIMPPAKVAACDALAAPGVFEEITPAEVKVNVGMQTADKQTKGGTFAMAVDPVNQGTIYAGTLFQGLWKSTDCGSTFELIATGNNAADVNRGMNWTLHVDPEDPLTIYTNSGYGSNGLFKSTDGGVNWTDIWSTKSQPTLGKAFMYNFANVIALDPADHSHILLTFHEACLAPHPATCIVETLDGGSTWRILDGVKEWNGNEGQVIFFMDNSNTWLWGSQTNGFWRSEDSGKNWEVIPNMNTSHLQGSQLLRTDNGAYYMAGAEGIWTSPDGKPKTWTLIPDTGSIVGGLVSDGTNMYASTSYFPDFGDPRYLTSPVADGQSWTQIKSPKMSQGGNLGYDKAHKLLYSSNLDAGLWRVVVP
jgi:hypothetical protein